MLVGRDLRFVRELVAKYDKDYFNLSLYWEAADEVIVRGGIVTFQVNAYNFSPLQSSDIS